MDIFARITQSYDSLKDFFTKLEEVCEKLIVYEHNGTRIHCHFYAVNCSLKTDAIKARIKKHLHVTQYDKSNWSFKTATSDGCIVYMTKGVYDPSHNKGFTQDELTKYRDSWQPKGERPKGENETSKVKSSVTQYDMSMQVYEMIKDSINDLDTYQIYTLCVKTSIRVCHLHRKGFDDNSIRKIAQPAYTKLSNMEDVFVNKVVQRFFS